MFSSPLKKGAIAGLSSSAGRNTRKNTAGQASSGTQTPESDFFNGLLAVAGTVVRALPQAAVPADAKHATMILLPKLAPVADYHRYGNRPAVAENHQRHLPAYLGQTD